VIVIKIDSPSIAISEITNLLISNLVKGMKTTEVGQLPRNLDVLLYISKASLLRGII
jgi:hypothetical protein